MKCRLPNILSLLLLTLCMAMGVISMRSYGHAAVWRLWLGKDSALFLVCSSGQIRLAEQGIVPISPSSFGTVDCSTYGVLDAHSVRMANITAQRLKLQYPFRADHGFAGFEMTSVSRPATPIVMAPPFRLMWRTVAVPCWSWMLLMAIPPVAHFGRNLRVRRRLRAGLCARCGYDLRSSKDRCPECGTPIPVQNDGNERVGITR